ncbi:MAG: endospore germination permease [Bacillota bacterium]|nr:endospore germination permease [Bacillota bacterium]
MHEESITYSQASCIMAMFLFGSTLIFGGGIEANRDSWLALIIAIIMFIPISLIYARLVKLFPGKNLFGILEELFGKIFGKILGGVFVWYAIYLAASILRNTTDFIQIAAMPETPQIAVAILLLAVIAYMVKCGMETFGKWSLVTFIMICIVVPFTVFISIRSIKWSNLLPIFDNKLGSMLKASYRQFSLSFGETVMFLGVAGSLGKKDSPYKSYFYGILCASVISIIVITRDIAVLGPAMIESVCYPAFVTGRIINPSESFARIESLIGINYVIASITKMTLCVFVAVKGMASLFNIDDYKKNVMPICLLCLMLSIISYDSVVDLSESARNYYPIYAMPFQIFIPLVMWITAEIKKSRRNACGKI